MCKNCEKLSNVENGKKETVVLSERNSTGAKYDKTIMQLNHDENGNANVFIANQVAIESIGRCYHNSFDIRYCPFCGEKLVD